MPGLLLLTGWLMDRMGLCGEPWSQPMVEALGAMQKPTGALNMEKHDRQQSQPAPALTTSNLLPPHPEPHLDLIPTPTAVEKWEMDDKNRHEAPEGDSASAKLCLLAV